MKTKNEFKVFLYCRSELNETLSNRQELQLLEMMSSETVWKKVVIENNLDCFQESERKEYEYVAD